MKKKDALNHYKTQKAIKSALVDAGYRISQPAISKWGDLVPEIPARILAQASDGSLAFDESMYRSKSAA